MKSRLLGAVCACVLTLVTTITNAALLTFTNESDYLSVISSSATISEGFETSPWFNAPPSGAVSVTSQGLIWSSSDLIRTNSGWARSGARGVYDSLGDPDIINIASTVGTLYSAGGWFKGSTATDLTFSIGSTDVFSVSINDGHQFFGIVKTDGFGSLRLSTSSGDWGADDFTFATSPIPIAAAIWLFGSGLIGLVGIAKLRVQA